jgi:hypothetical protein
MAETNEKKLTQTIEKIKKSMKDKGFSVFYLYFPDYERIKGKLKNKMTKEEYLDSIDWVKKEWYEEYGSCDLYCVADSCGDTYDDAYCISAVKYKGNDLRFDVVRRYDDDLVMEVNITDYVENLTLERLERLPAGHEVVSVESALGQVARAINNPKYINLNKKLFV